MGPFLLVIAMESVTALHPPLQGVIRAATPGRRPEQSLMAMLPGPPGARGVFGLCQER
jgi:hypothetical protein